MWLEEDAAHKVNARRAEQALGTKAGTVVTACPYCLQMFSTTVSRPLANSATSSRTGRR
jgi:Fe-S oxidoreductase